MRKECVKLGFTFLVGILMVSLLSIGSVIAEENESKGTIDSSSSTGCEDYCNSNFFSVSMPACKDAVKLVSGEHPDCECGWDCDGGEVSNDFEDDPDYTCEDMNQDDCETAEDCESIWGGADCDGDEACPAIAIWEGCRYEGDKFFEGYEDEELEQEAGSTPGDTFYFIDKFFDRFGDELEVKEERIAEIKAMVEAGDIEGAKISLKDYMELADELEHEIAPERREEAKRSAAAIRAAMKDIRDKLPPGERGKFVREVMSKEHSIATAAEIAGKIKDLCTQLAELDPLEYSKMCRTGEDAPKWQRELDADLTEEQEKIAREFVGVMKQCFKTSGQDCDCESIPFYDFSLACSKAAPLATACDVDGDEIACDELDNLDMPELPEWLEPIWEDLESGMMEAQYDMHMPPECVEAGVTSPKECGKVMIKTHAPLECRAALLEADVQSESEGRRICDKIMMEKHSPQCAEKGIDDPEECAKFMDSFRGEGPRGGPGFGRNCMEIEDPMERLDCYDNKGGELGEHYGTDPKFQNGEITWQCKENRIHWGPDCETFMREEWPEQEKRRMEEGDKRRMEEGDWRVKEKECALKCEQEGKPWDFSNGDCVCKDRDYEEYYKPGDDEGGAKCDDCASKCESRSGQRLRGTGCGSGGCECYYESDEPDYGPGEGPGEPGDYDYEDGGETDSGSSDGGGDSTSQEGGSDSTSSEGSEGGADSGSGEVSSSSSGDDGSSSGTDSGSDNSGMTGAVIGNKFLDYYYD
jgi:hypothetical protein